MGAPNLLLATASCSLVAPLGVVDLLTNHKPTLPSRKPLKSINFSQDMLHENVKFYLSHLAK